MQLDIDLDLLPPESSRSGWDLTWFHRLYDLGTRGLDMAEVGLLERLASGAPRRPDTELALLVEIGQANPVRAVKALQRRALVGLWHRRRGHAWSIPATGIGFWCEACGAHDVVRRRSRKLVWASEWPDVLPPVSPETDTTMVLKGIVDEARLREWCTLIQDGRILRYVVLCHDCAGHVRRCRHTDSGGRCQELAVGEHYCTRHRSWSAHHRHEQPVASL